VRLNRIWSWSLAAVATLGTVLVAATSALGGDYPGPPCVGCDYAGPPIEALARHDFGTFFASQPLMGSFSLLLRAPSALVTHGSVLWEYRLGAIVCLMAPLALGLWLLRQIERRGAGRVAQVLVLGLCVANPLTFAAMHWGHPEEPLAGALCVAAVLLAAGRQPIPAGVALGLALATKPWAWLVIVPVMLAGTERRKTTLLTALGVGAVLTLPMLLGDPNRFLHHVGIMGVTGAGVTPFNIWWGYAHEGGAVMSGGSASSAYSIPARLAALTHPLVIVVAIAASVLFWRRHPAPTSSTALQLVALLLLVRCLLDPLSISYHHVPFLLALTAAEATRRRGIPYLALTVAAISFAMNKGLTTASPDTLSRVYLSWTLPVALYLTWSLFGSEERAPQGRGPAIVLSTWRAR
jgi:glycosyl transferase family 87